ncbi:MAG: hypothetical protein FWC80_07525 [Firmicutes bacterium]|nr:hypothetical protein [Bacillota bacterium]
MIYVTGFKDFTYSINRFICRHRWLLIFFAVSFVTGIILGVSSAVSTYLNPIEAYSNYFLIRYLYFNRSFWYFYSLSLLFFLIILGAIFLCTRVVWLYPFIFGFFFIAGFRFAIPVILLVRVSGPITVPFLVFYCIFQIANFIWLFCYGGVLMRYSAELRGYSGRCDFKYIGLVSFCYFVVALILILVKTVIIHLLSAMIAGVVL